MDITFGSGFANQFATNIGLVTSNGAHGQNIMACEWTHHLSYRPGLIAVSVNPRHATYENIQSTGEFGIGICADDQSVIASVSGKESGRNFNKIKVLEEMGFQFQSAGNINVLMTEGTAANFECRLAYQHTMGDHTLFVGQVLNATHHPNKRPLIYHHGKYWVLETPAQKTSEEEREKINILYQQHRK